MKQIGKGHSCWFDTNKGLQIVDRQGRPLIEAGTYLHGIAEYQPYWEGVGVLVLRNDGMLRVLDADAKVRSTIQLEGFTEPVNKWWSINTAGTNLLISDESGNTWLLDDKLNLLDQKTLAGGDQWSAENVLMDNGNVLCRLMMFDDEKNAPVFSLGANAGNSSSILDSGNFSLDESGWEDNVWVLTRLTGDFAYLRVAHWQDREIKRQSCCILDADGQELFSHAYNEEDLDLIDLLRRASDVIGASADELEKMAKQLELRRIPVEKHGLRLLLSGQDPHEAPDRYYIDPDNIYLYQGEQRVDGYLLTVASLLARLNGRSNATLESSANYFSRMIMDASATQQLWSGDEMLCTLHTGKMDPYVNVNAVFDLQNRYYVIQQIVPGKGMVHTGCEVVGLSDELLR